MTTEDFYAVRDIGYDAARNAYNAGAPVADRDSFRDRVHPDAFSEALDAWPQYEAQELSEAIDEGIAVYLDNVGADASDDLPVGRVPDGHGGFIDYGGR